MINYNKIRKISFYLFFISGILLFVLSLSFVTPYYKTVLWGDLELESYFETELQRHNQTILILSLVHLFLVLYLFIIKFKKYNLEIYHMIITVMFSLVIIIFNITTIINYIEINHFYNTYDFSSFPRLESFYISNFWKVSNIFVSIIGVLSSMIIIMISVLSYIKYLEVKINET